MHTAYFIVGVQVLSSSFVSHSEQRIRLNIFYISKLNIQTRLAVPLYCFGDRAFTCTTCIGPLLIWLYGRWLRLAVSYIRFCEQEVIRVDVFLYIKHLNRSLLTDKCCRSIQKWTWFIFIVLLLLKTCGSSNVSTTLFYSFEPQRPYLWTHVFTLFGRVQVILFWYGVLSFFRTMNEPNSLLLKISQF